MIYFIYRLYGELILRLPLKISYRVARVVGGAAYLLMRKDRRERIKIIEKIFENKIARKEARKIIWASYKEFNKSLVDFFRIPRLNKKYLSNYVDVTGQENLDAVLGEGRGALLAGFHVGNGGFAASLLALKGYPVNIVVWKDINKRVDNLFQAIRQSKGVRIIYSRHAPKGVLEALKRNEIAAMTLDLSGGNKGVRLKCWGKEIRIARGAFVFAQKQGVPILPAVIIRRSDDTHKIIIGKPVKVKLKQNKEKGFEKESAVGIFNFFKGYIEEHPEQWYWLRNLWQDTESSQ
ncbi:MAG: lysophospholipid acyltransferase family protein [Candidatus Omnitrophica bacterium]|nr:lysophospholipid acyltransferase family protein [Candidatus Omnitrophota bacterium]